MSSYHCPHCGDDLENQPLFTADDDSYICDACGEFIYDSTTDIKRCKSCGAILNGQDDYEDWLPNHICSECYTLNEFEGEDDVLESNSDPISTAIGAASTTAGAVSSVAKLVGNIAEAKLQKQRAEESRQRKTESEGCFSGCLLPLLAFVALMLAIVLFVNRPDLALKLFNLMTEIIAAALELFAGAFENFFSSLS